jgi:TP901 family phage tail tape measure protein
MAGNITVKILGDASGLARELGVAESKMGGFGKAAVGVGAAVAGGLVGAGAALLKIGSDFDGAFDAIRVGTGATGNVLEGLKDDFRAVVQDVPADFGSAGTAIAGLNQRLGLTGKPLQEISKQVLELSRLTGSDLSGTLEGVTRVMGDWGKTTEEIPGTLDALFRASQATGIGVDALSEKVVQFGAPLRQMGFSFEESAALLGKFEKEGVNGELVMGSLRIALGKLAKAGEDAPSTFRRISDEIAGMKDPTAATAKAIELFGSKAGPDMAAAIREGRFELGSLLDTVAGGSETILGAAGDTEDFAEKWTRLKNKVFIALEPVATKLFDAIAKGMDYILPFAQKVGDAFSALKNGDIQGFAEVVDSIFGGSGRLVKPIQATVKFIQDAATAISAAFSWVASIFTGKGGEAEGAASDLGTTVSGVKDVIVGAFDAIRTTVEVVTGVVSEIWHRFGDDILGFLKETAEHLLEVFNGVFQAIRGVFDVFVGIFTGDWGRAWDGIKGILSGIWNAIFALIDNALTNVIPTVIRGAMAALSAAWSFLWNGLKTLFSTLWEGVKTTISGALDTVVGFVADLPGKMAAAGAGIWDWFYDTLVSVWNKIARFFNGLPAFKVNVPDFLPGPDEYRIGLPKLPELAEGGVVNGRTLLWAGEKGPEAIVPLDRYNGAGMGSQPLIVNMSFNGPVGAADQFVDEVYAGLLKRLRRNGKDTVGLR